MRELKISKNDSGQRLDKFLQKALPALPQSLMYKFLRNKNIKRNGARTTYSEKLEEGDVLTFYISDEFFVKEEKHGLLPYSGDERLTLLPSEIVYEDENILIIDKPQGETVHRSSPDEDTKKSEGICLIERVCGYLCKKGEYHPESENSFAPALCNRLDRNTGGLIIAAKNAEALRIMNLKIKERSIRKTYLCLVHGVPEAKFDTLRGFLYKDSEKNRVYIFPTREDAKRALHIKYDDDIKTVVTSYETVSVAEKGENALLRVELVTGRTHQIRAHMAYIGHPLVGDGKYGISHGRSKGDNFQRLYSYSVEFKEGSADGCLSYLVGKEFCGKMPNFALNNR